MIKVILILVVMPLSGDPLTAQYEMQSIQACTQAAAERLEMIKAKVGEFRYVAAGCALAVEKPEQRAGN